MGCIVKINCEFAIREIAGDYILIPLGEAALKFSGMITTNDVGVFMWEQLQTEISKEELLEKILVEFEIDKETAKKDMDEFLHRLEELKLL